MSKNQRVLAKDDKINEMELVLSFHKLLNKNPVRDKMAESKQTKANDICTSSVHQ